MGQDNGASRSVSIASIASEMLAITSGDARATPSVSFRSLRSRREQHIAPDEIKKSAQNSKRNQRQRFSMRTIEKWIVCRSPRGEALICSGQARPTGDDGDDDTGERTARDVTGSEQDAGAFVPFRDQLIMAQIVIAEFMFMQPAIDQPAHHAADENRTRRSEREINADGKGERRNTAHLERDRDHYA